MGSELGTNQTSNRGVHALAVLPNGDLIAGGKFGTTSPVTCVARWNGGSWEPLGTGMTGSETIVYTIAAHPAGGIVAGGYFSGADGVSAKSIARWNGTSWTMLGQGLSFSGSPGAVRSLVFLPDQTLVAGGIFNGSGPTSLLNVARWDGSVWSSLGGGVWSPAGSPSAGVQCCRLLPTGDLLAAGTFESAGGAPVRNIARWNGVSWSPVGTEYPGGNSYGTLNSLLPLPDGTMLAGGSGATSEFGTYTAFVSWWDGAAWVNLGPGFTFPTTLGGAQILSLMQLSDGTFVAGGAFSSTNGRWPTFIARWNGSTWLPLSAGFETVPSGLSTSVSALGALPDGDLVLGGNFSGVAGIAARGIVRRTAFGWLPMATTFSGGVSRIVVTQAGDLLIGGTFAGIDSATSAHVARWHAGTWYPLGLGVNYQGSGDVGAIAPLPNGDVIVGGTFSYAGSGIANNIARWNGTAWSALGSGANDSVTSLAVQPDGSLIVGGKFTTAGGVPANRIAKWDGAAWTSLGSGVAGGSAPVVNDLAVLASGSVIAAGVFTSAGAASAANIALWDGQAWSPVGPGLPGANSSVMRVKTLSNNDLVAAGTFSIAGGASTYALARWNGTTWSSLGLDSACAPLDLAVLPSDNLSVAGICYSPSGGLYNSAYFARYGCPPCYPNCDSSTSPPLLNANDFQCFLNKFAAADSYANCDHSTNPPTLNANDFQCFLNKFAAGCN